MSRRNAVCLAVILVTPPAAAAIASAFSLATGSLFPAMPAVVAAVIVNGVVPRFACVPARDKVVAEHGAIAYAIAGTLGYAVITVEVASWL